MLYLRFLSEKQVPVTVKLRDGEAVYGWIEYFDDRMIRLTREGKPNLFIYKNQIRTISESFRHIEARRRERNRSASPQAAASPAHAGPTSDSSSVLILPSSSAFTDQPQSLAPLDTNIIDASGVDGSRETPGNG